MQKFLIRNDDVAFDTKLSEIKTFCEICDKYGFKIIQAITLIGECQKIHSSMTNEEIKKVSSRQFEENIEVLKFLRTRKDFIAVHGLWHTHAPTFKEIRTAKSILENLGFKPSYFVPPFNEGDYPKEIEGLKTCQLNLKKGERLEDFLKKGQPTAPIMYLHSWRFDNNWSTFKDLDLCLKRLTEVPYEELRLWYNNWVKSNAWGNVLDVGKSKYWDYGYKTLDKNSKLKPTYVGDIEHTEFPDETFDMVLCNGMYEIVHNTQTTINETLRIVKRGGIVIFGFVGKDYKPYLSPWKFYEGKETWPAHTRVKYVKDFGNDYHYIIVKRI